MKWTGNLAGKVLWFAFVVFMLWKPLTAISRATVAKYQGQNSPAVVLPRNYLGCSSTRSRLDPTPVQVASGVVTALPHFGPT